MNGQDNLIPMSERSEDEVRELARKGGIASGEARRRKRDIKDSLDILLSMPFKLDGNAADMIRTQLNKLGVNEEDVDNQMAMAFSMFVNSVGTGKNAVSAATFIRDTLGEKPKEKVELTNDIDESIAEMEKYLCNKKV